MPTHIWIEIYKEGFKSQAAALAYTSKLLGKYKSGEVVDGEDHEFLCHLILLHPRVDQKIGVGVRRFEVRTREFGANCFYVVRKDGSVVDFSYKKCIRRS